MWRQKQSSPIPLASAVVLAGLDEGAAAHVQTSVRRAANLPLFEVRGYCGEPEGDGSDAAPGSMVGASLGGMAELLTPRDATPIIPMVLVNGWSSPGPAGQDEWECRLLPRHPRELLRSAREFALRGSGVVPPPCWAYFKGSVTCQESSAVARGSWRAWTPQGWLRPTAAGAPALDLRSLPAGSGEEREVVLTATPPGLKEEELRRRLASDTAVERFWLRGGQWVLRYSSLAARNSACCSPDFEERLGLRVTHEEGPVWLLGSDGYPTFFQGAQAVFDNWCRARLAEYSTCPALAGTSPYANWVEDLDRLDAALALVFT
jgi:hypothetical protein